MKYLIIPLLCILASLKVTLQSKFSKTDNTNITDNIFYNGIMFATAALILCPFLFKNGADCLTLIYGIFMGILSVIFQIFYICAFSKGKMTLTVIINNFSMLLPIAVSFLLFNESFGAMKIAGTFIALVSFCLNVSGEKKNSDVTNKNNFMWLVFTMLVFFSNGLISVNQKIYSMSTPKLQVFEFVAVAYITAALLSFLILVLISCKKKIVPEKTPGVIASGITVGILLGIFQCLNTYAAYLIDGTILYSSYNCGVSLLLSLIGKIFFNEKLSKKQYTGVFMGVIAIVLLCL